MTRPWLSKMRTKHKKDQLGEGQSLLMQALLHESWTAPSSRPGEGLPYLSKIG
jgi:hypothetical protein